MSVLNWTKFHTNQLPQMTCSLIVDEGEPATYSVGNTVRGQLLLNVSKLFHTYCLRVTLEGTALVKLGDSKAQTKSVTFFEKSVNVYGKGERIAFQAGDHKFPFALKLDPPKSGQLPGSMKSTYGVVIFQLVAYLQQELRSFKQAEKVVEVQGYYNLSCKEPCLMTPVTYEKFEKSSALPSFLCRRSSPKFQVNLRLPRSGYLLGDILHVELDMKNPDGYDIAGVSLVLMKKLTYFVDGQNQKVSLSEVQGVETRGLKGLQSMWIDEITILQEKAMVPSQKGIIEVAYFLRLKINSSSPDSPFILEAPIKIGTIK